MKTVLGTSADGTAEAVGGDPHSPKTAASNPCTLTTAISDVRTPETNETAEASVTDSGCLAGPSSQEQQRQFQLR